MIKMEEKCANRMFALTISCSRHIELSLEHSNFVRFLV